MTKKPTVEDVNAISFDSASGKLQRSIASSKGIAVAFRFGKTGARETHFVDPSGGIVTAELVSEERGGYSDRHWRIVTADRRIVAFFHQGYDQVLGLWALDMTPSGAATEGETS